MKYYKLTSFFLLTFTCFANASLLDIRHEYTPDKASNENADRVFISTPIKDDIYLSLESKWGYKDGNTIVNDKQVSTGHEVALFKSFQLENSKLSLTPKVSIDSYNALSIYKANLQLNYKATDDLSFAIRYRLGYKNSDYSTYNQVNVFGDVKLDKWKFGAEYEYKLLADNDAGYRNRGYEDILNFKVQYLERFAGWSPYAELGYVVGSKQNDAVLDDYLARYRIGINYIFK